jgi:hypothetical protein
MHQNGASLPGMPVSGCGNAWARRLLIAWNRLKAVISPQSVTGKRDLVQILLASRSCAWHPEEPVWKDLRP